MIRGGECLLFKVGFNYTLQLYLMTIYHLLFEIWWFARKKNQKTGWRDGGGEQHNVLMANFPLIYKGVV